MTNAPERIWIEDEFGDEDEDQWTYGTWDLRNYRGYVVEYVRADLTLPAVQPDVRIKEYEEAYQYALHLAESLRKNYPPNPDFQFLVDLVGLLTQIDNMVAGLDRIEALQASNLRLSGALYDMTAERDRLKAKIRFLERRALD